jgi:anti-sigma factor RsiW
VSEHREPLPTGRRAYRIAGFHDRQSAPPLVSQSHVDDLAAAYALGALEPDEVAAVDAHVRTCSACHQELLDAQRAAGMLSFVVPLHVPPADSKAALFARIAQSRKAATASLLPTVGVDTLRTPTIPSSAGLEDIQFPSKSDPMALSQSLGGSRSSWILSAVSVPLLIALIATGFWGVQLHNQVTAQSSQLTDLQAQLTNFGSGTTSYQLSPGIAAPQAEGQIVMGADQRAGMVQIDVNTDQGPRDFEMLVNRDGKLVPVSEVTVDETGRGQARFELDRPFSEYESVHIKAKPLDSSSDSSQVDTLFQDNEGALGSTGSGLDTGP